VLRAAGETETAQANIQDWLQLDEGDPGFQLLFTVEYLLQKTWGLGARELSDCVEGSWRD
jgi:hypothetical protein